MTNPQEYGVCHYCRCAGKVQEIIISGMGATDACETCYPVMMQRLGRKESKS